MNESVQEYEYDDRLTVFPTFFFPPHRSLILHFSSPVDTRYMYIYTCDDFKKRNGTHTVGGDSGKGASGGLLFFFLSVFFLFDRSLPRFRRWSVPRYLCQKRTRWCGASPVASSISRRTIRSFPCRRNTPPRESSALSHCSNPHPRTSGITTARSRIASARIPS